MKFKEPTIPQQPDNKKTKFLEIKRRLYRLISNETADYFELYEQDGNFNQLKRNILGYMKKKGAPELQGKLSEKLNEILLPIVGKVEELIINSLIEVAAENLTLEQIEMGSRESQKDKGYIPLSRGLSYELVDHKLAQVREIHLHIPTTFFNSPEEAIESMKEGLRNLAKLLLESPKLAKVDEIFGHSRLLSEKPRLARQLGFAVDEETGNALITKGKLLELYGPKDEK